MDESGIMKNEEIVLDQKEVDFLREVTDLRGTSGQEAAVRDYFREKYADIADKVSTDGMGSLLAELGTSGPRILAVGHMDEVGFMVRSITQDGFIRFARCGFFFITGVLSQHFVIQTEKGDVDAFCAIGPEGGTNKEYPEMEKLVMDVGCSSKEEAMALGIRIGDFIVPKGDFVQLGKDRKHLVNKAWDNRIGCAVSYRVMENLKRLGHPNTFIGGGSAQEEVGTRGAKTLGYASQADIGFSVDVGIADDVPGADRERVSLGKGPDLCFMDSGTISNRKLMRFAVSVAEECGIPYQTSVMKRGGTDAEEFQTVRSGMPVLLLNVPSRYCHTPTSMIHYDDYVNTVRLLTEIVRRLDADTVREIRSF